MARRSFVARLAALERLEAVEHERRTELTADDAAVLVGQIAMSNVRLVNGRAVRAWECGTEEYTARLDVALGRLNYTLARLDQPFISLTDLVYALAAPLPDEALQLWQWGLLVEKFPVEDADAPVI